MRTLHLLTAAILLAACSQPPEPVGKPGVPDPEPSPRAPPSRGVLTVSDVPEVVDEEETLSDDPAERVSYWIEKMCRGSKYDQNRAHLELAQLGKPAVKQLVSLLTVERAADWACESLAEIGEDAAEAIPALVERLEHPTGHWVARHALAQMGEAALEPMIAALRHESVRVRTDAANTLGCLAAHSRRSSIALAGATADAAGEVRQQAVWALGRQAVDADLAVPALALRLVEDEDAGVRAAAAEALAAFEGEALPALADLEKALADADGARDAAIRALAALGRQAGPAVPALLAAARDAAVNADDVERVLVAVGTGALALGLRDPAARVRRIAAEGFLHAPESETSVALLHAGLKDVDAGVREACVSSLVMHVELADPKRLLAVCSDPVAAVRAMALDTLSAFDPDVAGVVDAVIAGLKDSDGDVRSAAARSLQEFAPLPAAAIDPLVDALGDPAAAADAAVTLGAFGPAARRAAPALRRAMAGEDLVLRARSAAALVRLAGVRAEEAALPADAVAVLKALSVHERPALRSEVVKALGVPEGTPLRGILFDRTEDADAEVRHHAVAGLVEEPWSERLLGVLRARLADKHAGVRMTTAAVLGTFGDEARAAVPDLEKLLRDRDTRVRYRARFALEQIRSREDGE